MIYDYKKHKWLGGLVFLLILGFACKDKPDPKAYDFASMPFYCDYRVTGDEESNTVTVLMQFRAGSPDGPGMLLDTPASVSLDGYPLEPDSTRMHGVYYEQRWLAHEFNGGHQIKYVTPEGDSLVEKFSFPVFGLAQPLPEKWSVTDTEIEITGLPADDSLHILLLDTAYLSRGIDRFIRLEDSKIKLSAAELGRLRKGPIIFHIYRDRERELKQANEAGGRLATSFMLSRRFILE